MVRVGSVDGLQVWQAHTASGRTAPIPLRYMSSSYRRGFRHRLIRYYNRPPTVAGNRQSGLLVGRHCNSTVITCSPDPHRPP